MEPHDNTHFKKHPYSRFTAAVAAYVVGVASFSLWSFFENRRAATTSGANPLAEMQRSFNKAAWIECFEGTFLLAMVFLLVVLYHRARAQSLRQMKQLNHKLRLDYQTLQKHESELEDAIKDLERFNALTTGREERIMELKTEVNALLRELDRPLRYTTAPDE